MKNMNENKQIEAIPQAGNPFGVVKKNDPDGMMGVAASAQIQEVQGMMVIAKKFQRDPVVAWNNIMQSCKRIGLAEKAVYAYPRGSTTVSGPSIRLAEVLAQNWGNVRTGVIELEQRPGESTVKAYAWDLQTNAYEERVFNVRHERKSGDVIKHLTDPRDIYELIANQGARRRRACILAVIPPDVVEDAVKTCEDTMKKGNGDPLVDRIKKMVAAFADFGITPQMIEKRLGHKVEVTNETEFVALRRIYTSINDGAGKREDFFKVGSGEEDNLPDAPSGNPATTHRGAEKTKEPDAEKHEEQKHRKSKTSTPKQESGGEKIEGTIPVNPASPNSKPEENQNQAPQPDAPTVPPSAAQEADENIERLQQLVKISGSDEPHLVKWLIDSEFVQSPIEKLDEMKGFAPRKLQKLAYDWEKKYKMIFEKWLSDNK